MVDARSIVCRRESDEEWPLMPARRDGDERGARWREIEQCQRSNAKNN
jgi:hypothetical protein